MRLWVSMPKPSDHGSSTTWSATFLDLKPHTPPTRGTGQVRKEFAGPAGPAALQHCSIAPCASTPTQGSRSECGFLVFGGQCRPPPSRAGSRTPHPAACASPCPSVTISLGFVQRRLCHIMCVPCCCMTSCACPVSVHARWTLHSPNASGCSTTTLAASPLAGPPPTMTTAPYCDCHDDNSAERGAAPRGCALRTKAALTNLRRHITHMTAKTHHTRDRANTSHS